MNISAIYVSMAWILVVCMV